MRKKRNISACIIACNEGGVIERCLDSIEGFVDEICVIDTGSSDDTYNICKERADRVVFDPSLSDGKGRITDFSAARNRALALSSSRWVLVIDADEILTTPNENDVHKIIASNECCAVSLPISSGRVRWFVPRLFLLQPNTRYKGIVHEYIEFHGSVRPTRGIEITNLPNKDGKESSTDRDLRLCRMQLDQCSNDGRALFYYARALRRAERYSEAIDTYLEYLQSAEPGPGRYAAWCGLSICYLVTQNYGDARNAAKIAFDCNPGLADACCLIGDALLAQSQLLEAKHWFLQAIDIGEPPVGTTYFYDRTCFDAYPKHQIELIDRIIVA